MNREIILLLIPAAAAFCIPALTLVKKTWGRTISALAMLAGAAYAAFLMPAVLDSPVSVIIGNWQPPFGINLYISPFSLGVVFLLYAAAFLTLVFDFGAAGERKGQYYLLYDLVVLAAAGMVFTADLFNLFVFLEISGIASFALIAGERNGEAGSLTYLIQAQLTGLLMLAGIALVYSAQGVLNTAYLSAAAPFNGAFAFLAAFLIFLPLLLEIKLFPFHTWVGRAYGDAAASFGGTMSSITATAAAAVITRLVIQFTGSSSAFAPAAGKIHLLLLILGSITVIFGETAAFRERQLKRVLAYSSVGQMGMITVGIAAASHGSITGAVILLASHSAAKLLLFFVTGYMIRRTGKSDWRDMKGLARRQPLTGVLFVIGAMTLMGIPLFAGFWGKLELLKALAGLGGTAYIGLTVILVGTVFEGVYFMKIAHNLFEEHEEISVPKPGLSFILPALILALAVLAVGVYPRLIMPMVERITADLTGNDYIRIILSTGGSL